MNMSIYSAYFITTAWDRCVLLSLNLHGATEQDVLFYTGICLPHCPHRNCHLWRLPKFYILGQLLLKNKKRKNKKGIYIISKTSQVWHVPLLHLKAAQKHAGQLLTLEKKKKSAWGSHRCNTVTTPLLSTPKWRGSGIYCMTSDFGWSTWVLISVVNFCKLIVKLFFNLCPRLRLCFEKLAMKSYCCKEIKLWAKCTLRN